MTKSKSRLIREMDEITESYLAKSKAKPCPGSKIRSGGKGKGLGRGRGKGPVGRPNSDDRSKKR